MSSRSPRAWRPTIASSTARRTASTRVTRSESPPVRRLARCSRRPQSRRQQRRRAMKPNNALAGAVLAAAVTLSGCATAPPLTIPAVPTAPVYKEAAPWTPAQPADGLSRGQWWKLYGDADLNALQTRLIEHSPDLAAALARYNQAKAYSDQQRSGLFPSLVLGADAERDGLSNMRPLRPANSANNYNSFTVGVQANYELDLWGRIRNEVAAGRAQAQASGAELEPARWRLNAQIRE